MYQNEGKQDGFGTSEPRENMVMNQNEGKQDGFGTSEPREDMGMYQTKEIKAVLVHRSEM